MLAWFRYAWTQPRFRPVKGWSVNQWLRGRIEHHVPDGRAWYYRAWPRQWQAKY